MKEKATGFRASTITLAIAGLVGYVGAVQAQAGPPGGGSPASSVQLYGTVDLGVGRIASQPPGPPNAPITRATTMQSGGVTTTYFGMRGSESLGGSLRAQFQLESFLRADTGASGRFNPPGPPQDPMFSRAAWVGLAGDFGDVKLGRSANPAWLSMIFSSAMGSNSIFSPSFRQQYNGSTRGYMGLDSSLPNSLSYTTPRLGGVTGTVAVQAGEGRGKSNYSANVVYRGGPIMLTAGMANASHVPPPDEAAVQDQNWFVLGASYDFKVVKVFAQYTDHENELTGTQTKTPHLGLTVPIGNGELQAAWARGKATSARGESERTTTSMGYIHNLSKRTNLYAMLASDKLPVGTANSYLVGVRHAF